MRDVLRQTPLFDESVTLYGLQQFILSDQTVGILKQADEEVEGLGCQKTGESARDRVRRRGSK